MDQIILSPSDSDIPCTQDIQRYKHHPGNMIYKAMIEEYAKDYYRAKQLPREQQKAEVTRITGKFIEEMATKQLRFIESAERNGNDWKLVDKAKARDKVRHALKEQAKKMNNPDSSGSAHIKEYPIHKSSVAAPTTLLSASRQWFARQELNSNQHDNREDDPSAAAPSSSEQIGELKKQAIPRHVRCKIEAATSDTLHGEGDLNNDYATTSERSTSLRPGQDFNPYPIANNEDASMSTIAFDSIRSEDLSVIGYISANLDLVCRDNLDDVSMVSSTMASVPIAVSALRGRGGVNNDHASIAESLDSLPRDHRYNTYPIAKNEDAYMASLTTAFDSIRSDDLSGIQSVSTGSTQL
jgi:hypothetical protein